MRDILSPREKEILDVLTRVDSVKLCSLRLGIKTKTIYNTLYRIRKKYLMARKFVNQILAYRNKGIKLEDFLTPRVKFKEREQEFE